MGQPKERSAKKMFSLKKYDEIRSFDGNVLYGNPKNVFKQKNRA